MTSENLVRVREVGGSNPPAPTIAHRRHHRQANHLSVMPTVTKITTFTTSTFNLLHHG
jgi:hypothetical protein